jgi:hypothetical protein
MRPYPPFAEKMTNCPHCSLLLNAGVNILLVRECLPDALPYEVFFDVVVQTLLGEKCASCFVFHILGE